MENRNKGIIKLALVFIGVILFATGLYLLCKPDWEYEVNTTIKAKILISSINRLGIQYNLGNINVLDDWLNGSPSYVKYLENLNKKHGYIEFELNVYDKHGRVVDPIFTYYLPNGVELFASYQPLRKQLVKNYKTIPGFRWLIKDGKKVTYKPTIRRGNAL